MKEDKLKDLFETIQDKKISKGISFQEFRTSLLEILVDNKIETERYLLVLLEEIASYSYREGFKDGSSKGTYNFTDFKTIYLDELRILASTLLNKLVEIND